MMKYHQSASLRSISWPPGLKALHPEGLSTAAQGPAAQLSNRSNSLPFWNVLRSDLSNSNLGVDWMLERKSIHLGTSAAQQIESKSCEQYLPQGPLIHSFNYSSHGLFGGLGGFSWKQHQTGAGWTIQFFQLLELLTRREERSQMWVYHHTGCVIMYAISQDICDGTDHTLHAPAPLAPRALNAVLVWGTPGSAGRKRKCSTVSGRKKKKKKSFVYLQLLDK